MGQDLFHLLLLVFLLSLPFLFGPLLLGLCQLKCLLLLLFSTLSFALSLGCFHCFLVLSGLLLEFLNMQQSSHARTSMRPGRAQRAIVSMVC